VGLFAQKHTGRSSGKSSPAEERTALLRDVAAFVTKQQPDVICLQEFYIRDTSIIPATFYEYPYHQFHLFKTRIGGGFGNLTLSRYPIISGDKILFKGGTNLCIYSDIRFKNNTLRVYNVHFESHSISFTGLIKKLAHSESLSEEIADVHDKVAGTFKKRALQVDKISDHAKESVYPSFICGDFNDTPMSYTYHNMMKDKKDSFGESGKGFSATYTHLWPLLRIDYILYPGQFNSTAHKTVKVKYSDHYPVFADIIIP
jgi:endonuclease/exonuclease/phosphatase family metal-dependent hydrolase